MVVTIVERYKRAIPRRKEREREREREREPDRPTDRQRTAGQIVMIDIVAPFHD